MQTILLYSCSFKNIKSSYFKRIIFFIKTFACKNNVREHDVLLKKAQFSLAKSDAYLLVKERIENASFFFLFCEREKKRERWREGASGVKAVGVLLGS